MVDAGAAWPPREPRTAHLRLAAAVRDLVDATYAGAGSDDESLDGAADDVARITARLRAAVAPANHVLDRSGRSLEDCLDPPIVEVAHPAFYAAAARLRAG